MTTKPSGDRRAGQPRVTLLGYGRWGRNIARNLHQLGALGAVYDPDLGRRNAADEALNGPHGEQADPDNPDNPDNPDRVAILDDLDSIDPSHAVAIAAPAAQHADLVRRFLQRDQHVFVEKPLALDVAEGRALAALAKERNRVLMVGHLLHYHPAITRLSELVATGVLGRLRYLYSHRLNLGRFRREESSLWSFAPHDIAIVLRLVGAMPERVIATGGHYLHPRIADTTVTQLAWDSGVQAHIYVSWLHPFKEQRLVVVGETAMAVFDDRQPLQSKLVLYRHGVSWQDGAPVPVKAEGENVAISTTEPLREEMRTFLDALADPTAKLHSDGDEGARVLSVLDAAQRSLEDAGQWTRPDSGRDSRSFFAHATALVGDDAKVGANTKIWHFCHVMNGAEVGADCVLGQNVFVQSGAVVGDRVKLQNNVSVYDGVVLGDDVFCGPSAVFTNVNRPRAHVNRRGEFAATRVGQGATIGANATVVCGHNVGHHAFIGAGAVVTRDVAPHSLVLGCPASHIGWVCSCGERLSLAADSPGEASCDRCEKAWRTDGTALSPR